MRDIFVIHNCDTYFDHELVSSLLFVLGRMSVFQCFVFRDIDQCLKETKCDGIMIAGKTLDILHSVLYKGCMY